MTLNGDNEELLASYLQYGWPKLNVREQAVLVKRLGLAGEPEATLRELAERHGVTRERIRGIQGKALWKLRKYAAEWSVLWESGLIHKVCQEAPPPVNIF